MQGKHSGFLVVRHIIAFFLASMAGVSLLFTVQVAQAAGFRQVYTGDTQLGVWYPSETRTTKQRLGPFEVDVALEAPIRTGLHELVLFSHGNGGHFRNHYLTAQALADAGFVVIAPQHKADHLIGSSQTPQALQLRYIELKNALNAVFVHTELKDNVQKNVVHGLGYSLGGATILLATGAEYSSARVAEHCTKNSQLDVKFCKSPSMFSLIVKSFLHKVNLPDTPDTFRNSPLVSGKVILVAPVSKGIDVTPPLSMTSLSVFAIDGDTIAKPEFHSRPVFEAISRNTPSELQIVQGHHYAFIAPFPKWLTEDENIPVAKDPAGFDRAKFLRNINEKLVSILVRN